MLMPDLSTATEVAESDYFRLVLLVGLPGSGKTQRLRDFASEYGYGVITVGGPAAAALLELPEYQRPRRIAAVVTALVDARPETVILLDDIELLFDPSLATDPLRLLQTLSRNRTIVAAWPGEYVGDVLTYADAGHPEHRVCRAPDVVVVNTGSTSSLLPAS